MKERFLSFPLLLLGLALVACNPSKTAFQLGIPGHRTEMTVGRVVPRFGFEQYSELSPRRTFTTSAVSTLRGGTPS